MPSWYDTAQQNIATQAGAAAAAAPAPSATVAQNAVNQLSGQTNAFTTAANTAQNIATGAANPWITDASGAVTPNTATAMGGLFAAQNQQLKQMIPNITADPDAASIGSGQFGSLRGQTAANKAIADAQANLFAQQNQAALENQRTGVTAATAAGDVTNKGLDKLLEVGQYEQAAPFTTASNYGKVMGGLQAPTTVTNKTQLSPLNQVASLISAAGGPSGTGGLLKQLGVTGGLSGLVKSAGNLFNTNFANNTNFRAATNQTPTAAEIAGGKMEQGDDGKWYVRTAGDATSDTDTNSDTGMGGVEDDEVFTGGEDEFFPE